MKVKKGFILREMAGNIIVVPTGNLINEFRAMITLNSTGKFIWELLQNDISFNEIVSKLVEKYKIDENKAKKDAEKFISKLQDANIIEE